MAPEQAYTAFTVGDVRIDVRSMDQAVSELLTPAEPRAVHLCNAYTVALAARDRRLARCLDHGDLSLADGMPLVWAARRLGFAEMTERVYGPELMQRCLDEGRSAGTRHALFGSTPEVLEELQAAIARRWPGAEIALVESPPFRDLTDAEVAASARRADEAGADIVWVGLGTPKQDVMVERLRTHGQATYVGVGAAFDFIAGHKRQAPTWMGEHGLEWVFRLVTEPRRLARRYLVGNVQFLAALVRKPPARLERPRHTSTSCT